MRWIYVVGLSVAVVVAAGCGTETTSAPPVAGNTAAADQESSGEQGEVFDDDFESGKTESWSEAGEEMPEEQDGAEEPAAEEPRSP